MSEILDIKSGGLMSKFTKWEKFWLLMLLLIILGFATSYLAKEFYIKDDITTRPKVLLIAPMSGDMKYVGDEMFRGVSIYIESQNKKGGYRDRLIELEVIDSIKEWDNLEKRVNESLSNQYIVGAVGAVSYPELHKLEPIFINSKTPLITPLFALNRDNRSDFVKYLGLRPDDQARFVANYARNVTQQRIMYIIHEDSPESNIEKDSFASVYEKFGTPIKGYFKIPSNPTETDYNNLKNELSKIDIGAIFISSDPSNSANILKSIRESKAELEVYGTDFLTLNIFHESLKKLTSEKRSEEMINGVIASTSVIFDTANEEAQKFLNIYRNSYQKEPDWIGAMMFDATKILLSNSSNIGNYKEAVIETLSKQLEVKGVVNSWKFNENGTSDSNIKMALYNGNRLISAPIQLQPISKGAISNFIEALRGGRVLYVNDKFMYKTNVVYSGIKINDISNINMQEESAVIDFEIWFRYKGNFAPEHIMFLNAIDEIKLDKAVEKVERDDIKYERYKIKHKFKLNFSETAREYGTHTVGISFKHKHLNYNNLLYVTDILGMPKTDEILEQFKKEKVISKHAGWYANNIWFSQELIEDDGDGAPQYVVFMGEKPLFSSISLDVLLKPTGFNIRDYISSEYFIYLAIFSIFGILFARMMDLKQLGKYWAFQSWILRLIFFPTLLLSFGNLILDYSFAKLDIEITRVVVLIYEISWWLIPSHLINLAIKRFVWELLEAKSGKKIPNIVKLLVTITIYLLAFTGINAFVFGQTITSILAASGVLAMVVGLAIKSNIANVFSGIILNIERPFKIGDRIRVLDKSGLSGEVIDITWRTTKLKTGDGPIVSFANGRITESVIQNDSQCNGINQNTTIYLNPEVEPKKVIPILLEAMKNSDIIINKNDLIARYQGVISINGYWVGAYYIAFDVKIPPHKGRAIAEIWNYLYDKFKENDIKIVPIDDEENIPKLNKISV